MERSAVAKIESGLRGLSALELVDLSAALGTRPEWLLADAPEAVVAYRTRLDPDVAVTAIDTEIERLAREMKGLTALSPGLIPQILDASPAPQTVGEADALAALVRHRAGVAPDESISNVVEIASRVGLLAFSAPLGTETADAASTLLDRGGVALVNSSSAVGRRRIALAHELGHYAVHDPYVLDWRVTDHASSDRTEMLLDRFARAFLAPAQVFESKWAEAVSTHDVRTAAVLVGNAFGIDMSTIARRLTELDIADAATVRSVRSVQTLKADIIEYGLLPAYDMEGVTVPTHVARSVLKLYREERLSPDRTVELLSGTISHEELPPLRPAHRDGIWSVLA